MKFEVIQGDALEAMRGMASKSVDAVITDPPYGLSFMGKRWDYEIPSVEIFKEIYRLLKDGSRLLCFAGTRTMHRMWCNIEDAGFTIEDSIMWIYGSGFPKHKSKLKPAYEPICVARKGHSSALNIDECRIEGGQGGGVWGARQGTSIGYGGTDAVGYRTERHPSGRWPANIILDEVAAEMLDEQSGMLTSGTGAIKRDSANGYLANAYGKESRAAGTPNIEYGDTGGASRFFYCAKASRAERNEGCEGLPFERYSLTDNRNRGGASENYHHKTGGGNERQKTIGNHHPTVKPLSLMRHLCKLVTPKDGLILDPFAGSFTTGVAASLEGFNFIGCEQDAEYCEIGRARLMEAQKDLPLFQVA